MGLGARLTLLFLLVTLLSSCAFNYDELIKSRGIPDVVLKKSTILELQSEELKQVALKIRQANVRAMERLHYLAQPLHRLLKLFLLGL